MRSGSMLVLVAAALLTAGGAEATAPATFRLVFDGHHNAALLHEGTFATTTTWCASGSAADESVTPSTDTAVRRFTCAGGGEFTAKVEPLPAEHGGSGTWQIVAGTGPLADLRGKGTFTSVRVTGSSDDPATITFRSTWDGVADFDATPPTLGITGSARVLNATQRLYRLRVVLSLTDASTGPIAYVLEVVNPRKPRAPLIYKLGRATTATVTSSFRIAVPRGAKALQVRLDGTDPVGNDASTSKTVRLTK
jgi:hypothetical protein